MSKKSLQYLLVITCVLLFTLILLTLFYFLSKVQGNNGITFKVFGGGDDGLFYWEQAQNVARNREWIRTSIYPLLIGNIIKVPIFNDPFFIRIFNYFAFFLLVVYVIKLMNYLIKLTDNESLQKKSIDIKLFMIVALMCYGSLQMNLHISILRDVWMYFLYVASLYFSMRVYRNKRISINYLLCLILSLWLLGEFRAYLLLSFIVAILVYSVGKYFKAKNYLVFFLFIMFVVGGIYYTQFIDFPVPIINMTLRDGLNYRLSYLEPGAAGGSQMNIDLAQSNYFLFLINYLYSYASNFFGPLPWQISGISTLIIFFTETIPMVLILIYIYKNRGYLSVSAGYILVHSFTWILFIALSNDNIGTGTRLRPISWILILLVFSLLWNTNKRKKVGKKFENIIRQATFR
ncbi:hypothetical protein HZY91_00560 [Facklamia sp. DSM 111018]|uniref:Uncharacterized protein n=1 Tax=Facklamia lactis TaxID=2749967 RepID=A0ABS0LPE8_9LACT|nr:hypothetical protein [Facklamia lactis]MBG9979940.1 hypothetical protein [Facklamia lactis]MBG9985380.1 hypothetical protein [Facklamia lactis]